MKNPLTRLCVTTGLLAAALGVFAAPSGAGTATYDPAPALQAVATAVAAGLSGAPLPSSIEPPLNNYANGGVNLGRCDLPGITATHLCQVGDPHGSKTVVIFGNSHATMWVPALESVALAAHWKLYLVLKDACGYDTYIDYHHRWHVPNNCTKWYQSAVTTIASLHPDVLIIGSYSGTPYWYQAEDLIVQSMRHLAHRFVIIGDDPRSPAPGACLNKLGATQGTCLYTEPQTDIDAEITNADLARDADVQYVGVGPLFCDAGYCPALINGFLPTKDGAHLTRDYSASLSNAFGYLLNLTGGNTRTITSLPLPTTSTTSTTLTTTSTTP